MFILESSIDFKMCRTGAAHWNIPKVEKERFWPARLPCLSAKSDKLARYQPWKQCINGPEDAEAMKHSEPHEYLLWSNCSVQSLVVPTGRMVFLFIQICNSLRSLSLQLWQREFAQQQLEGCFGFVSSEYLRRFFGYEGNCACLREKLSHDHYYKIVMRVEISMCDCLRNNDTYYFAIITRL